MVDTSLAKKKAWDLNKQLLPRPAKYFEELDTFVHQESCINEVTVLQDGDASELLTALLSVACFSRHGRSYIVDSGASHHLISLAALTAQEQKTVRKAKFAIPLPPANAAVSM